MNANGIGKLGLILIALVIAATHVRIAPYTLGYPDGQITASGLLLYQVLTPLTVILLLVFRRRIARVAFGRESDAGTQLPETRHLLRAALGLVGLWLLADTLPKIDEAYLSNHFHDLAQAPRREASVGQTAAVSISIAFAVLLLVGGGHVLEWWARRDSGGEA